MEVEAGRVVFEMEAAEFHYNPLNIVHGGMTSTLLDTVMGCAAQTLLEPGVLLHDHRPAGALRARGDGRERRAARGGEGGARRQAG